MAVILINVVGMIAGIKMAKHRDTEPLHSIVTNIEWNGSNLRDVLLTAINQPIDFN